MRLSYVILIFGIVFLIACGSKQNSNPAALFPNSGDAPGWAKKGEMRTFEASSLWEYIDGDAEKYLQAGVQRTLTTDYRYEDKIDAVADVYVMKAAEGAKKVMESEPLQGGQAIHLGDAGRLYGASLTFRQGSYFVRLIAYDESPEIGRALVELGRALERKLEQQRLD
jgi:hypothetical protein